MHIGLCSPQWPPSGAANGIVSYVAAIRAHFLMRGHRVSVISQNRLYNCDGVEQVLTPTSAPRLAAWRNRLAMRVDAWRGDLPGVGKAVARQIAAARAMGGMDIVEMEESFGWSAAVQRDVPVPVVTRLHGPHFLKPTRTNTLRERWCDRQRTAAEGRAIRMAHALTAPTRAIMSATCAHYGVPPTGDGRIVIPNPIAMPPPAQCWHPATCEAGHILMVGRFDFWKGADTLLAAFALLIGTHPHARLTLVGPDLGIATASGKLTYFHDYAQRHLPDEARERVTFTGPLNQSDIAELRRRAAVTVLASRCENLPYALLEAAAAGCPVVSTDWPGSEELVVDGVTGLHTPVGNPAIMAQRIGRLLDSPNIAAVLGTNARDHCARHFALDVVGDRLLHHYADTLTGWQ